MIQTLAGRNKAFSALVVAKPRGNGMPKGSDAAIAATVTAARRCSGQE